MKDSSTKELRRSRFPRENSVPSGGRRLGARFAGSAENTVPKTAKMPETAKKQAKKTKKAAECPHCRTGRETFSYLGRRFAFDVDLARKLTEDGREPVEVDEESVRRCLARTRIYDQHLEHVDTKYPGIIAHVSCTTPEGDLVTGHVLIDGNHRAARTQQLGQPFFAYLLTEEESVRVLKNRTAPSETAGESDRKM
jgi:hypothetical protein